jgi:hypothetical protein
VDGCFDYALESKGGSGKNGQDDFKIFGARAGAVTATDDTLSFSNNRDFYELLAAGQGEGRGNQFVEFELPGFQSEYIIAVAHQRGKKQNNGFRVAGFKGAVPEPTTLAILGVGLVAVGGMRRRLTAA